MPTTPYDAKGLLKTAVRDDNPVLFFTHKLLIQEEGPVPDDDYLVPLGVAEIRREGDDVTVVATSYMVTLALQAAESLASRGVDVEVIDPRTLEPLDIEAIVESVRKTGRLVVVDEAYGDFSGEESWVSRIGNYENLAVLRTLSKVGAAAWRCGFLAANKSIIKEVNKVRPPFNVNAFTQAAAGAILEEFTGIRGQVTAVVRERVRLADLLRGCGIKVFPSRANFLFVQADDREKALWTFLQLHDIVVKFVAGNQVTGDALRITIGTRAQNDTLVEKVRAFFGKETGDETR